jgi:hypothetical protein
LHRLYQCWKQPFIMEQSGHLIVETVVTGHCPPPVQRSTVCSLIP